MENMVFQKIYFPRQQIDLLHKLREATGISISEHVRRSVDLYFEKMYPGSEVKTATRRGVKGGKT